MCSLSAIAPRLAHAQFLEREAGRLMFTGFAATVADYCARDGIDRRRVKHVRRYIDLCGLSGGTLIALWGTHLLDFDVRANAALRGIRVI